MPDIQAQTIAVISEQLGVKIEEIKLDSKIMDDLGADSLDTVELVMALEERFGLEISDEEAEKLLTVEQVIKYLEKMLKEKEEKQKRG